MPSRSPRHVLASLAWMSATLALYGAPAAADETATEHVEDCRHRWLALGACADWPWDGPQIEFGATLGVSAMNESGPLGFGNGVGAVMHPGPAWGVLIGVEVLPWLAFEGRYLGMYDGSRASVSSSGGFLASAATASVRLTAPLPYVHPYVFGGVGYYDFDFDGPASAALHSSSQAGIPLGVGIDIPLGYHLSVGAEASYNFQLNENYSNVTVGGIDGGDVTRFDLVLRARL